MIKIRWIITDDLREVSVEEFNTEWNGIYGYFEMCINNQVIGYVPNRKLFQNEEWNEEILYWIVKLAKGFNHVIESDEEYEIQLLSMNLRKIIIKKERRLKICFVNVKSNESDWEEEIECEEFYEEICDGIDRLLSEIRENNRELLEANLVKEICDIQKVLVDPKCKSR